MQTSFPAALIGLPLQHHDASDSHVGTVISQSEHAVLTARAGSSPFFVLPLQKPPTGFCTLMMQWQQQQLLVTTLDEFKQHGSAAPPHFVMTLYDELADSHGLVLARGDVLNPKLISKAEVWRMICTNLCPDWFSEEGASGRFSIGYRGGSFQQDMPTCRQTPCCPCCMMCCMVTSPAVLIVLCCADQGRTVMELTRAFYTGAYVAPSMQLPHSVFKNSTIQCSVLLVDHYHASCSC